MLTTTLGRFGSAARRRLTHLARPLAALGLLLATAGAAQAQTPTLATPVATPISGVAPYGPAQHPALVADPTLPGSSKLSAAPARTAAPSTARTTTTQRLGTTWTTMAAMSQARAEPGATAHPNGKIYVWGGYDENLTALASAEAYTPSTNTWAAIASLPITLCGPATAVGTDGSIYSFGGRSLGNNGNYFGNSYKYNTATNTWAAIAPLPVVRWEARALTAPDGRIFVFGGWNATVNPVVGSEVQIYTPATNTWSMGTAMPVGLFGSAAGVDAAGLMHLYGGITTNQAPTTTHLVYNATTNSWATALATPTPARAYTTGLAGPDGTLYLCGGDDNIVINSAGTYYSQVDSYNPSTATWSSEPALPVALTEAASAATGGYLYVVGGTTGTAQSALYRIAVVAAPTLTTISPNPAMAGTSVTLTGSNLSGATAVTFTGTSNNTVTTGLTVGGTGSSQTLTVVVPTGATSGNVTVTTPGGTSNGVAFTVVAPVTLTTASPLPGGTVGVAYSQTFRATGGSGTYTYAITAGALPAGMTLASNGAFSGTPTAGGTFTFTVRATDNSPAPGPYSSTQQYTFTVAAPTLTVAPATLPGGTVGAAYSQTLTAAGGTAPYTYALAAGALPSGLTLTSGGTLAGTPTGSGSFTFTVTATDASTGSGPYSGSRSYTLTIAPPPAPAAPVVVLPANNSTTNSSPVFQVTATPGSYLTVYLNGANPSTNQYLVGSNGTITGRYSGLADGVYTLYATASAQRSGAPVSAPSNTVTFTVDGTAPTATVSTTASSPTSTAPIPFAVTFSEPVTGFSASSLTVSNGTVTAGSLSGSGPYAFTVTPTGNGPVTVSVAANAVQDAVGNGNPASNALSVQYTAPVAAGLSVLYQTGDFGQPTDGQVRPFLQLVNSGTTAVPYSSLTVRYWLTVENFMGQLVTPIDYAKLGTNLVSARYVALATPRQGALGYIEYAFSAGAGSLAPGTDSGPIYGKAYKPDYSNLDETDDWSYQTSSSFTTNAHVTLYQNGTLLAGTEPPAVDAVTALQVFSASRDASASPQYVSVQLQVRNTGNVPVNYSDVRVRYYFTRDGAASIVPQVDYAKLGSSNISLRVVNLPAPVNGADAYLEIGFSSALGVFYPRTSTDDILFKLRKDDYSAFDQTNDYSFTGSTSLAINNRITALASNRLVFGTPPAGAPARVAASSAPASAGGATIVAAASGPQALTASPNPFAEQFTLRFALPTAQAYTLAVYDGQGRLVQQVASGEAAAGEAQEVAVSTQGYAAGLYLVRLTTVSGTQTLKLVKP